MYTFSTGINFELIRKNKHFDEESGIGNKNIFYLAKTQDSRILYQKPKFS